MSRTPLDDAVDALCDDFSESAEHPSVDELVAYRDGKLDDESKCTALKEHLAWCPECCRTLLVDLAAWPDIELDDPSLARTDEEEAEDWQAIRHRLGHDDGVSALPPSRETVPFRPQSTADLPAAETPSTTPPASRHSYGAVHLLAAILLLTVVGLLIHVARLSREPAQPQANVFVVDLEPAGEAATRDRTAGPQATRVPSGMETIVFLLVQDDLRPFDDHAVELRAAGGEILWQSGGLISPPEGGFSMAVPLSVLPTGEFEMHLYGVNGGERELLATYRTRVEHSASG